MHCPQCGQETEEGKFCTNCGAQLPSAEPAAAKDQDPAVHATTVNHQPVTANAQTQQVNQNEAVEKVKTAGTNFGHFFLTLLKKPSEARNANSNDLISGIITMVIFSLLLALGLHLSVSALTDSIPGDLFGDFGGSDMSFFDSFVLPLVEFILLFLIVSALTFAGTKLATNAFTFTDVLGKYGAYQVPFLLLYAVGFLFALIGLTSLSAFLIMISILGTLMVVPTLILMEQHGNGFDRVYSLLAIYFISLLVFGFFMQSFIETLISSLFGSVFDQFGGF
ncbi:DUF6574 domain-containing protein [Lentibacillus sp. N15]|uniref:DUF6574 domain-containing protein n=1 Tax=Lentibacillus songyuanensis TaxID=3136161 RepID=UPI0031BA8E44